ncbi:hypothetical protein FSP39_004106 [Pinctada imbricata]|uniref:Protein SYS1 homolog n=1 Tax=Pinctada imbricata TaxID=66713 RepID=A0AA89BLG8_PINIB|nr:hypothetical protein FSP39_004106 [Pinctada imbricata]
MQCQFYFILGLWTGLLDLIGKFDISLEQIFSQTEYSLLNNLGRVNVIAFLLNSLTSAIALWYVVQRTKLCLDFAVTAHLVHLVISSIFNAHLPKTLAWWILNITSVALMTVLGEYLCMRTEMKAIPLSMGAKVDL